MRKIIVRLTLMIFTLILLTSLTSAAGVATSYWDENPLKLAPGESDTITLYLQNMVGNKDITLRAEFTSGNEIAILTNGPEYAVPLGKDDIPVNIKIEVPGNSDIGTKYDVALSFQQISDESGQMLHLTGAFTSDLPIEVVGESESALYGQPRGSNFVWVIITILLLITLFSVSAIRKRKRKK